MKKLLAILLSITLIIGVFAFPVNAAGNTENSGYLFEDEFYNAWGQLIEGDIDTYYKELDYHYDENGDVDWAFVFCRTNVGQVWLYYYQVGNRLIYQRDGFYPLFTGYGVYDVQDGKFYDISKIWNNPKYECVVKMFDEVCEQGLVDYYTSVKIGDMNNDGYITVGDATYLQKCLAGLEDYPVTPEMQVFINQKVGYASDGQKTFDINDFYDVNEDGTVSIGDATKLQRISAEFDN